MAKKPAPITINLIPKDPFFETPVGKTLKWALSVGRYIVIFTELIVILSFVARFSLDRQVTDLNDSINQKQNVIESYGSLEQDVREVQARTDQYNQVKQQSNIADIFPQLSQITPPDIRLEELVIRLDSVQLRGTAFSNPSLNLFINNLQLSENFTDVTVDRIESGDERDPGFTFQVRAQTSQQLQQTIQNLNQPERVNILDRTQGIDEL